MYIHQYVFYKVRFCNVYGIDIPTRFELVAHNRNEEEITIALGADR